MTVSKQVYDLHRSLFSDKLEQCFCWRRQCDRASSKMVPSLALYCCPCNGYET
jgi:hypothetical protein